ncbi:MAG: HigA family addiction module antitoxin [Chloroflexota bacterium]|nr:HigA family addiction module antitoxin [Chloroflexota bacterium]
MVSRTRRPPHPGETLRDDVMAELDLDSAAVATQLGVAGTTIENIVAARQPISADLALRLGQWLGTSPEFWLRLQEHYDLELARMEHGDEIRQTVIPRERIPA